MTALIIIVSILLFFALILNVHAFITFEMAEQMALTLRILFIRIKILPKKEKTYKIKDYSLKKIRKREQKAAVKAALAAVKKKEKAEQKARKKAEKQAELAAMTKAERKALKAEKKASRPALTDLIPLILRTLGFFSTRFFWKLHIKVAKLYVRVGAADAMQAAVLYGIANQSIQYFVTGLQKLVRVDGLDQADIRVEPDFLSDKIEFEMNLTVRVSLGNLLWALIKAGWRFLVGYIRIKPDPDKPKGLPKPSAPPAPSAPATPPAPDQRA